ncbi:MAG TPA: DUF5682 family protein [Kofleriaceae bacterium]|nr:DUF5682 family protein [Kofleriaceae bacterium]
MIERLEIAGVEAAVERVLAEELYWFPVRHHSPAVARHLRAAIKQRKPKLILIEGPADASHLIEHIVDAKTKPPVALYASYRDDDNTLGLAGIASAAPDVPARFAVWYPLLPYSPEYVAMKDAAAIGADAVFIDLPNHALIDVEHWKAHGVDRDEPDGDIDEDDLDPEDLADASDVPDEPEAGERPSWESFVVESSFYQTMARVAGYRSWDEAWDSLFEIGHRHTSHEEFRRELAYFCCAVRATSSPERIARDGTLERERHMKRAIAAELAARKLSPKDAMVVCGGFHLFLDRDDAEPPPTPPAGTTFATVVPYSYFRVSELTGYGAGNRAPKYYQSVWEHQSDKDDEPWVGAMVEHVTSVLARGRKQGELLSAADAISVAQHARMLAALRGRPAPILDDIRDALISCCCKGRPEEEGRHLLAAMTTAEVGTSIGRVTPALGRLPIVHDFYAQLDTLDLGEVMGKEKRLVLTLDLRDDLGAKRSAFLHRLAKLDVPLGDREGGATGDGTTLFREKWRLGWSPKIEAALIDKNLYGDSIETAAMAQLEEDIAKEQRHAGATCKRLLESVAMQLPHVMRKLEAAAGAAIDEDRHFNSQCDALVHLLVLDRLAIQRELGRAAIEALAIRAFTRACLAIPELGAIPVDQQELTIAHLKSLAEAVLGGDLELDRALFTDNVKHAAVTTEVPFMQGAFAGILTELRELDPQDLAKRVAAFATSHPTKMVLAGEFLDGAFAVSKTSMLLGADALVAAIDELLRAAPWDDFMNLLPKVRNAFERLHERQRLAFADRVAARYGIVELEQVTELAPTSATAAAYMAQIDARVAAIMKEWTF